MSELPAANSSFTRGRQWLAPLKDKWKALSKSRHPSPSQGNDNTRAISNKASVDKANVQHTHQKTVNNIAAAGNVFTGTNYGVVNMNIDTERVDFTQLNDLPTQADISGQLSEYYLDSRIEDERHILRWIDNDSPPELVLCVLGKAGVGKSTFAKHLSERLRMSNQLAASVFFAFVPAHWGVESIIKLIANQLGRTHPRAVEQISQAIREYGGPSVPIGTQIENFILEPIRSLRYPRPLVVVLDALDQWEPHPRLAKALACLSSQSTVIRFVVLGRSGLQDRFQGALSSSYHLLDVSQGVLINYITERFDHVNWKFGHKPDIQTVTGLAAKAEGLFVWVATVCSLLQDQMSHPDPHETLTAVLHSRHTVGGTDIMANLYYNAIGLLFPRQDHKEKLRAFLGALLVLQESLPLYAFASLVSLDPTIVRKIQSDLGCLRINAQGNSPDIIQPAGTTFHLSFLEYLQSTETPTHIAFPITPSSYHCQLGKTCLKGLPRLLSLPVTKRKHSAFQTYAVKYWPTHTINGTPTVSPASDTEWKETPHYAILNKLTFSQVQEWAKLFLSLVDPASTPLVINGTESQDTDSEGEGSEGDAADGDAMASMLLLTVSQLLTPYDRVLRGSPSTFSIALVELSARLQHRCWESWSALSHLYRHATQGVPSRDAIERSVQTARYAMDPACHYVSPKQEVQSVLAHSLATSLLDRYEHLGGIDDLHEAIGLLRQALDLTPEDDEERMLSVNNLASALRSGFLVTGDVKLLDESIDLYQGALSLLPPGHPHRQATNLANSLWTRFEVTGAIEPLEQSIALNREILSLRPPGHPSRGITLNALGWTILSRYEVQKSVQDLQEATSFSREALELVPLLSYERGAFMDTLARALRYNPGQLEEALSLSRGAVELGPNKWERLNNLSVILLFCYKKTQDLQQLEEAISTCHKALELCPLPETRKLEALQAEMLELHAHLQ